LDQVAKPIISLVSITILVYRYIKYSLNQYNHHILDTSFINCSIYSFYETSLLILLWFQ